ncbi:NAD(P)-binding domain-containing protein [Helicobacter pylori]|uniref:NAD(P)-binding domain-containing protein n=1 Tax=Helicobacter pylori TaxID=210 RepID=UPI000573D94D|nr:NAD(P)-binding domain-containing protein [Helicobacter pylori]KHL79753.1 hypothetical protein HPY1198_01760 [Helicobacter pylori]
MSQEILDVLIVGAGPGGIATAVECEIAGVKKALLCEKTESHSGMLEKFYKAGKRIDKDYKKQVVELKGHIPFKDSFKEETLENFTNLLKEHRINEDNAKNLQEVLGNNTLKSKLGVDIESLEEDGTQIKVNFTDNTSESFDRLLYAIGGSTPLEFFKRCSLELDPSTNIPVVKENLESNNIPNLFIVGDILFKSGASIATALNHGYDVAQEIAKRLRS